MDKNKFRIGIIGLGYVGLPLAIEFSKKFEVVGYDINSSRVQSLKKNIDYTKEVKKKYLKSLQVKSFTDKNKKGLLICSDLKQLSRCNFYIITVPTPVDKYKRPNMKPLISASEMVGSILKKNDFVVYESTVYPGATEDDCLPILEKTSGLKLNKDFFLGYSPERINPGDKKHTLTNIKKVTSGSNKKSLTVIDNIYSSIISAGTYMASSIKVAEAAKVIENTQRDINIAFVNELSKIFNLMDIDTEDVLSAAATKWNFLKFKPGLVGGHCIGVDPYYLAHKAKELGYNPEIILAGRRINDSMPYFIASQVIKKISQNAGNIHSNRILILGFTFKENCPDYRNTKIEDLCNELKEYGAKISIYDPIVNTKCYEDFKNLNFLKKQELKKYDTIILSVPHEEFKKFEIKKHLKKDGLVFDIKSFLPKNKINWKL